MAMRSGAAARKADFEQDDRHLDSPEFINRLAENMRVESGSDLPLSCFVEQVRMQLAGGSIIDLARATSERLKRQASASRYESSDCFKAWAMPE
jgi:hypothetical protein